VPWHYLLLSPLFRDKTLFPICPSCSTSLCWDRASIPCPASECQSQRS
jgi:hypothetical protein